MPEKANSQLIRTINERRLLNLIRQEGPISRNELAKRAKISKVAVSGIINRLDKDGFILVTGKGESTSKGGKRPMLLKLNPDNGYVIGIQIMRGQITIALANVESTIKGIEHHSYEINASIDEVISNIFTKIDFLSQNIIFLKKNLSVLA
ncbi:winged helix-turn-helix transcriptional regulator [candidate division KSB1 bacterium]|nr:winged helix-turn-helix transcriptional regulator [candidate division KSB1 bacterium]MBL7094991.1 winged helix-turn-helix transcriptional regulator [candidate division KSB1 bacterium]